MKVKVVKVNKNDVYEPVKIKSDFIKLDALLKFANICESGGTAKLMIASRLVKINDKIVCERGKKVRPGDRIIIGTDKIIVKKDKTNES